MINPLEDKYWVPRGNNKLLTYLGPPLKSNLDKKKLKRFLAERSAFGAIWYYDDNYTDQGPWYRTACDQSDYDIDLIKSKSFRRKIRKCLKYCQIRLMDLSEMLDSIYDVYLQASKRYKNLDLISKDEFKTDLSNKLKTHDLKAFGVFCEENLIAYMIVMDFNDCAMGYLAAFDPGYSKHYPMYGLCYFVAKYFVSDRGYKEFNRGTRPLLHETNIDEFLISLGYRKKYCRLGIFFVSHIDFTISALNRLSPVLKYLVPKKFRLVIEALIQAKRIAHQTMKSKVE
ncbi:MAG: GNAT family N-acetyltransferase [Desulfobacteraceae bacterium]|jgi:hypothetical protein